MSRSRLPLRRALLGVAFAACMGFGVTQAFATPGTARSGSCERTGYMYIPNDCPECGGSGGFCDGVNEYCVCTTE